MTADHWCGTLTCGSSEQTSKQKELKKIHVKRGKGALGSNRHTNLAAELIVSNSPVQPFKHPCGIICPGFGQDGVFPISQKPPWEPAPSCRPALGRVLSPGVTAAGGTPAVLPVATGGRAGAANSLPWMEREKAAGKRDEKGSRMERDEMQHGFGRGESGQSRQLPCEEHRNSGR